MFSNSLQFNSADPHQGAWSDSVPFSSGSKPSEVANDAANDVPSLADNTSNYEFGGSAGDSGIKKSNASFKRQLGLLAGAVFLLVIAVGGIAGYNLMSQGTDQRSQASAARVANLAVKRTGLGTSTVAIDGTQLPSGTKISRLKTQLSLPIGMQIVQEPFPVDEELMPGNRNPGDTFEPIDPIKPKVMGVSVAASTAESRLGEISEQSALKPSSKAKINAPSGFPTVHPTNTPIVTKPVYPSGNPNELLAQSEDGYVRVTKGTAFNAARNVLVTINKSADEYLISISEDYDTKNEVSQKLAQSMGELVKISHKANKNEPNEPVVPQIVSLSIKGYWPNSRIETELTKISPFITPTWGKPSPVVTVTPTAEPKQCRVNGDCPKDFICKSTGPCKLVDGVTICVTLTPGNKGICVPAVSASPSAKPSVSLTSYPSKIPTTTPTRGPTPTGYGPSPWTTPWPTPTIMVYPTDWTPSPWQYPTTTPTPALP